MQPARNVAHRQLHLLKSYIQVRQVSGFAHGLNRGGEAGSIGRGEICQRALERVSYAADRRGVVDCERLVGEENLFGVIFAKYFR